MDSFMLQNMLIPNGSLLRAIGDCRSKIDPTAKKHKAMSRPWRWTANMDTVDVHLTDKKINCAAAAIGQSEKRFYHLAIPSRRLLIQMCTSWWCSRVSNHRLCSRSWGRSPGLVLPCLLVGRGSCMWSLRGPSSSAHWILRSQVLTTSIHRNVMLSFL